MKESELFLIRNSGSRSASPETGPGEGQVLGAAVLKAQKVRESRKLSWVGYEDLIKQRAGEDFGRSLSVSPSGASRLSSRLASPDTSRAPSRGPSPAEPPFPRRPSPVDIRANFGQEPPDLYSFPKSKTHVRFSTSLANLPDDSSPIRRGSPVERGAELQVGPVPPASPVTSSPKHYGRPSFAGLLSEHDRRSIFGGGAISPSETEPAIKVTYTPRVPGDEAWREGDSSDPPPVAVRLENEGLSFKVPDYLSTLRGTSRNGVDPAPGARLSNIAGVPVSGSHRRSTFVRAVEAVTILGASLIAPSTERITSKYVTTAAKKNSTVIVPVNAKQWLLQSLRMKDWELRELFDQMEMIPQLAADHVRDVRAEWESLEARSLKVPPEADMLLKDQQLLETTKALLRRFIEVVSKDETVEGGHMPPQETPDFIMGTTTSEQGDAAAPQGQEANVDKEDIEAWREQLRKERDSFVASTSPSWNNRGSFSPVQFPPREKSGSVLGRPICYACGRMDTSAPNTIIRGNVLPRESVYQEKASPIPRQNLPSFIPFEDYVVKQSVVKPTGKSDQFKTTYSPLDKRWYTVLFPALQPGKREDVTLLSEWLMHATRRNGVEDSHGHFSNVETAFVLHCIAFLEIVRQVRIHCEERGDMILYVWRQLLRIFNQVMTRAEPKVKSLEEEVTKLTELHNTEAANVKRLTASVEKLTKSFHDTEEKLKAKGVEISKLKRCRLCLAGNMTPRTRENYIKRSMMKRFSTNPNDPREKAKADLFQDAIAESAKELAAAASKEAARKGKESGKEGGGGGGGGGTGQDSATEGSGEHQSQTAEGLKGPDGKPLAPGEGGAVAGRSLKSSTVITFLRAALLKRSQRLSLDEAAKITVAQDMAEIEASLAPKAIPKEDKQVQTDEVTVEVPKPFAQVLKRSASCPARMSYIDSFDPEQHAKHRSWMEEQGLVGGKHGQVEKETPEGGEDDEVEIVVADRAIKQPEVTAGGVTGGEGGEGGHKGEKKTVGQVHKAMKKHVNKLATETLDALGALGAELSQMGGGADVAFRMAALISKWKKVAKATSGQPGGGPGGEGGAEDSGGEGGAGGMEGGGGDGEEFEWEDAEDDGEDGDGKGRRRKKGKGSSRKISGSGSAIGDEGGGSGKVRRSVLDLAGGDRRKRGTGKNSGTGFELGKLVPLGFAKMMNINTPPKVVKFFNERQLTKLITAVYTSKIEADAVDDAADGERQSSCEFVYDFMLNLYGLKRLAESAVWGLFKKIKQIQQQKKIDKAHKARMFNRFCGMDDSKFYSERDLYLYLKVLAKGMSKAGLFYPSEQDDGISFVNCVWAETFAEEPTLVEYLGTQAAATEFINQFVAAHAVSDKVSLEVKKITKSQTVKRIDFDELMEAILEKGSIQSNMVMIPKKVKKGDKGPKGPLTAEKRQALENLFTAGDANQDGVLTFTEFREILSSADESISQQTALRIFRETLLLEPEGGDKISPLAFATVAHNHNIAAPPSVIFNLLKKTYLQIQGDVNENKVKDEESKKESDELRMKLAKLIDEAKENTTDVAVQIFKEYVLKFCGAEEGDEEQTEEEEEVEDDEVDEMATPPKHRDSIIEEREEDMVDEAGPSNS